MNNEKKHTKEEITAIENEELRDANLTPSRELSMDEVEQVTGGTFLSNKYENAEYAEAGITVEKHTILKDEFIWKGQHLNHSDANAVVAFYRKNGRAPASLAETERKSTGGVELGSGDLWK